MNDVIPGAWTAVISNGDFICAETLSGYRSGTVRDPKGKQNFLDPEATDEALGIAVLDAMASSRFVVAEPRSDVWIHPEVEYDKDLFDHQKTAERYADWVKRLMERYGYKTKLNLFRKMKNCYVKRERDEIVICPSHHEKPEAWGRTKGDGIEDVIIPADSTPAEIGAALRLAFSRCTG